jgi:hypothetical protein
MTKKHLSIAVLLWSSCNCHARAQQVTAEDIPDVIARHLAVGPLSKLYEIDGSINPFYLRGDFDGDGIPDYAVRIRSVQDHKTGIAIWLTSRKNFTILGAGVTFKMNDYTITDFQDLNTWQVYGKGPVAPGVEAGSPPRLRTEAILAGKSESASGLIYWNGRIFVWYQQGD